MVINNELGWTRRHERAKKERVREKERKRVRERETDREKKLLV